jgi:hypothetical protein
VQTVQMVQGGSSSCEENTMAVRQRRT